MLDFEQIETEVRTPRGQKLASEVPKSENDKYLIIFEDDKGIGYLRFIGNYDHYWGPEIENYSITRDSEEAKIFTSKNSMAINLIDVRKFLPKHKWTAIDI